MANHTVGSGIRFAFSKHPGARAYDADFFDWATTTACDYEGRRNIYGLEHAAVRIQKEKGESILILRDGKADDGYRPKIQLVDPDALDPSASPKYKGNVVVDGIEVRRSGAVVGRHFLFIDDFGMQEREFVFDDHTIHLFELESAGQLRGIPAGATVISRVQIHDGLFSSVMAKAWVEACFGVAITRPEMIDGEDVGNGVMDDLNGDSEEYEVGFQRPAGLNPGLLFDLDAGQKIETINPSSLGGYDSYIRMSREDIAAGYGVP